MNNYKNFLDNFTSEFKHAFAIEKPGKKFEEDDLKMLEKLANGISKRRMSAPAILFLDTLRPMSYIGSQTMIFFRPIITMIFSTSEYDKISRLMERRESANKLIQLLENK